MSLTFGRDQVCRPCGGSGRVRGMRCASCGGSGVYSPEKVERIPEIEKVERPVARRGDPDTSWEAADSIEGRRLKETQTWILEILREEGPLTDEEIWEHLQTSHYGKVSPSGARTRRSELVSAGLIQATDARKIGKTGRRMIVWRCRR